MVFHVSRQCDVCSLFVDLANVLKRLKSDFLIVLCAFYPSIIYFSKTSKHINRANQFKNTYDIGLDTKVHVGLFNRLHVTHKIILNLK